MLPWWGDHDDAHGDHDDARGDHDDDRGNHDDDHVDDVGDIQESMKNINWWCSSLMAFLVSAVN